MATTSVANDKKQSLQQQIEALRKEMDALDQEAIHDLKLKLGDARRLVSQLEQELATLTARSATGHKPKHTRRPSITDDALQDQVLEVMAHHGKDGMNAKQLADKLNQDALRVRKFINAHPKVLNRQGSGPGTKLFLP